MINKLIFYIGYLIGLVSRVRIDYNNIFVLHSFGVGGAEVVHLRILQELNKKSLIIFLNDTGERNLLKEYKNYGTVLNYGKLNYFTLPLSLGRLSASICYNKRNLTIFGFSIQEFYLLLRHLGNRNHKVIDIIHASILIPVCPSYLISRIDTRIVIDNNTLNDIKDYYLKSNLSKYVQRIQLIGNYTDKPKAFEKKDNQILKIIFVGRDSYEKRIHLVEKIAIICLENKLPVKFLLVGPSRKLETISNSLFASTGLITDAEEISNIYRASDIILVTSTREGFPMALMEAMSYGIVPITTAVGGIPFHIKNMVTGFLVDEIPEDLIIFSFVNHIKTLINNRALLKFLSNNCTDYAINNFSKSSFGNEYRKILLH